MNFSTSDVIDLLKAGGFALAIAMGFVVVVFWRALKSGLVEWGESAQRERKLLTEYGEQMRNERDQYATQVKARQVVVDQAVEKLGLLTELLRDLRPPSRRRGAG